MILGNDVRYMSEEIFAIVTNRDLIALDQDELGHIAEVVRQTPVTRRLQVFVKRLADPKSPRAVAYFNRGNTSETMSVRRSDLKLTPAEMASCTCVSLRDLQTNVSVSLEDCMNSEQLHNVSVLPHQALVYLATCHGTADAALKSDDDATTAAARPKTTRRLRGATALSTSTSDTTPSLNHLHCDSECWPGRAGPPPCCSRLCVDARMIP